MTNLILLDAPRDTVRGLPPDLWKLRWRLLTTTGLTITSSWTPETRYPSMSETFGEFKDHVAEVFVDAVHRYEGTRATLLRCPGHVFKGITYKGMGSASGRAATIGIEIEDHEGNRYLVLRNGKIHVEERKG